MLLSLSSYASDSAGPPRRCADGAVSDWPDGRVWGSWFRGCRPYCSWRDLRCCSDGLLSVTNHSYSMSLDDASPIMTVSRRGRFHAVLKGGRQLWGLAAHCGPHGSCAEKALPERGWDSLKQRGLPKNRRPSLPLHGVSKWTRRHRAADQSRRHCRSRRVAVGLPRMIPTSRLRLRLVQVKFSDPRKASVGPTINLACR